MSEKLKVFRRLVCASYQFDALHYWKDAPDDKFFLRTPHRHVFHVMVTADVSHGDRDIEFLRLKDDLAAFCDTLRGGTYPYSCEVFAEKIGHELAKVGYPVGHVQVYEDGENGALVVFEPNHHCAGPLPGKDTCNCPPNEGSSCPFRRTFEPEEPNKVWKTDEPPKSMTEAIQLQIAEMRSEVQSIIKRQDEVLKRLDVLFPKRNLM